MASSFIVYIDEAGDEGFKFDRGSSSWLVLSALVIRRENDLDTVKIVDDIRDKLGKPPRKPLHFRDLKHDHRVFVTGEIIKQKVKVISICFYKPYLDEAFKEANYLYFFATRLLLERVSWLCRDAYKNNPDKNNDTAHIVFSNRASMSYKNLKEYLVKLQGWRPESEVHIDWDVIKVDAISTFTHGKRMGLQLVDAVASAYFKALEPNRFGYTEPRYAEMLSVITYNYRGKAQGYGLKFFPAKAESFITAEDGLKWVERHYK